MIQTSPQNELPIPHFAAHFFTFSPSGGGGVGAIWPRDQISARTFILSVSQRARATAAESRRSLFSIGASVVLGARGVHL